MITTVLVERCAALRCNLGHKDRVALLNEEDRKGIAINTNHIID